MAAIPPAALRRPLLAVLVASSLLSAVACGGDDESAATTTTEPPASTTTRAPSTTEPPGDQIFPFDLATGDCFEERLIPGQGQIEVEELFEIDCADPHDNEVYLVTNVPDEDGTYPGDDAIRAFADEACLGDFEGFIGLQYELSRYEIGHLVPTEDSWASGDRQVICFVFDRDGTKLEGSVEGTAG